MINSAGSVATNTFGVVLVESFFPGSAAFTSFQLSSAGSFEKLSGTLAVTAVHGPLSEVACNHDWLYRTYIVLVGAYSNRSQFVFSAYLRSTSLIGLQIGSPSRLINIAGATA